MNKVLFYIVSQMEKSDWIVLLACRCREHTLNKCNSRCGRNAVPRQLELIADTGRQL